MGKSVLSKLLVSNKGQQDRRTPKGLFDVYNEEFNFELDPCSSCEKPNNLGTPYYFTKEDNGLSKDWSKYKSIFINPPFNKMPLWIDKVIYELAKSTKEKDIVVLVPCKTETRWFHNILNSKYFKEMRFETKRLTFEGHKDPFIIGIACAIFKKH